MIVCVPVAKLILFVVLPNKIFMWFILMSFLLFGMETKKSKVACFENASPTPH